MFNYSYLNPPQVNITWENLNWKELKSYLHNYQCQIYQTAVKKDFQRMYDLQFQVINDFNLKLLAVRQVARDNEGKKTPGIDGVCSLTGPDKVNIACNLFIDGISYYIRRVRMPKPETSENEPLGIPILIDRAKQTLVKYALEPQFESYFESNSYGFRPMKFAYQAINKIRSHLIFSGPSWVLNTDVKKCFDNIDHSALLRKINAIPAIDHQLRAWLNAGIIDKGEIIFPRTGTPQGETISPLLANIALDGIQSCVLEEIYKKFGYETLNSTTYIRYADDLVVLSPDINVVNTVHQIINRQLSLVGLDLRYEKTRLLHTLRYNYEEKRVKSESFEFLGYKFIQKTVSKHHKMRTSSPVVLFRGSDGCPQKFSPLNTKFNTKDYVDPNSEIVSRYETYIIPSPNRIQRHKSSVNVFLRSCGTVEQVIYGLSLRVQGWTNYFRHSDASSYCNLPKKLTLWLNRRIRFWLKKTVKSKKKSEKYWKKDTKEWRLCIKIKKGKQEIKEENEEEEICLHYYSDQKWRIPKGIIPLKSDFSPYNVSLEKIEAMKEQIKTYLGPGLNIPV